MNCFKNSDERHLGFLATYMSTSWDKSVAQQFLEMTGDGKGLMIGLESLFKMQKACDVSWISKFPNEKEILFARHHGYFYAHLIQQDDAKQYIQFNSGSHACEKLF
eukprot:161807_1